MSALIFTVHTAHGISSIYHIYNMVLSINMGYRPPKKAFSQYHTGAR